MLKWQLLWFTARLPFITLFFCHNNCNIWNTCKSCYTCGSKHFDWVIHPGLSVCVCAPVHSEPHVHSSMTKLSAIHTQVEQSTALSGTGSLTPALVWQHAFKLQGCSFTPESLRLGWIQGVAPKLTPKAWIRLPKVSIAAAVRRYSTPGTPTALICRFAVN